MRTLPAWVQPRTIRFWLTWLVVICIVPTIPIAGFLAVMSYERERTRIEGDISELARALMQAVDKDLKGAASGLQALATSPHLAAGDLAAFYDQAREAIQYQDGNNIVLTDLTGQQLINTIKPFGEPLPPHGNLDQLRRVVETGKPAISNLFMGMVTRRLLIAVEVPVFSRGQVVSVLSMGFFPDRLGEILRRQNTPPDWTTTIFDRAGVIVARPHASERFVGQKGPLPLIQRLADVAEGTMETETVEGVPVLMGFNRSAVSGWSVAVSLPRADLIATARKSLWIHLGASTVVLLLAAVLAAIVGLRISRSIQALSGPALALGTSGLVAIPPRRTNIQEVDEVGRALLQASELIQKRTSENQRLNAVVSEREKGERKFRALVEQAPDAMVIVGGDGRISLVNAQSERLFGYSRDELVGQRIDLLVPERVRAEHVAKQAAYMRDGRLRAMGAGLEIRAVRKDGTEVPVEIDLAPLHTEEGILVVSTVRDVTERRRQADQLENALLQAERANQAKSGFLASMSHELRTPLNAISGFAQLLTLPGETPGRGAQLHYAQNIRAASKQLLSIVDDVLDMARVDVGRIGLDFQSLDCLEIMTEVARTLEVLAKERGVVFTVDTSGNLPWIVADRRRLVQVLLNLGTNAIKYNVDSGWVLLKAVPLDGVVRFVVKDTGRGIPADRHDQVFEPFNRLGAELGSEEGTGLGLAISRRLVRAMKGKIGFESTVGQGSTFWVDMRSVDEPGRHTVAQPAALPMIANDSQPKVLYIEDKIFNIELMRSIIENWKNAQFMAAQTVEEGLRLARAVRPDVIMTDIHLPDGKGFNVLERLRADPLMAHIPIVALTADAMRNNIDNMRRAGFDFIVTKPFEIPELMEILRACLEAA
jgi:PAS domain S-box-containing protein